MESSVGCWWISAPLWLHRNSLHQHRLLGDLCSSVGNTYCALLLHLPWCLQNPWFHRFALLSLTAIICAIGFILPHLQYIRPEAPFLAPMGSTLPSCKSTLELAAIGSSGHGGSLLQPLTEDTSVASPHYQNQYMSTVPCLLLVLCTGMGYFMCCNPLRGVPLSWVIHDSSPFRRICPHSMELLPRLCIQLWAQQCPFHRVSLLPPSFSPKLCIYTVLLWCSLLCFCPCSFSQSSLLCLLTSFSLFLLSYVPTYESWYLLTWVQISSSSQLPSCLIYIWQVVLCVPLTSCSCGTQQDVFNHCRAKSSHCPPIQVLIWGARAEKHHGLTSEKD